MSDEQRARVVFLVRVPVGRADEFRREYERIRYRVAETAGYLSDELCRSVADPEQWLITSEWRSLADFAAWESSPWHRELAGPLRSCATEARSLRFAVHARTVSPASDSPASDGSGGREVGVRR